MYDEIIIGTHKHLQPDQHYTDLYDKFTIEECRDIERGFNERAKVPNNQGLTEKEVRAAADIAVHLSIYCYTGERALKKEETIQSWIRKDREKDERLENAATPHNISCRFCGGLMTSEFKELYDRDKGPERVLFLFRCEACKKGRGIFEDGREWEIKQETCPQCRAVLSEKEKRKGNKMTTTYTCLNCGYTKQDVLNLSVRKKKEKPDPYFERDRARFCLTKEQTQEYLEQKLRLESLSDLMKEQDVRDRNKPLYDAVAALKKLSIDQLEQLLVTELKKDHYAKLEFRQPEIDKHVIVPFTIRDTKADRDGRSSELRLQQRIRKILDDTTWRLMSEGVSYRLGILTGKLKGYEREEDLLELVLQQKKNSVVRE